MRFAIIYSRENSAGKNIAEVFRKNYFMPQVPIIELKKETLYTDIDIKKFPELRNIDFLVFTSTHKSKDNKPALCVHAPGNWRSADYGGKEGVVCMSSARIMKYVFMQLEKNARAAQEVRDHYAVSLEATHHGPVCIIPCCFIEVGSTDKEYHDNKALEIVAQTIASLQEYKEEKSWIPAIAVGGPHYAPSFNNIQLNSKYAISHIIPSYALPLTEKILQEAEAKTKEQVKTIIIDWKGCGKSEEREAYIILMKKMGFNDMRSDRVR
jgi:D-aminoacyl-tRNA deacylase